MPSKVDVFCQATSQAQPCMNFSQPRAHLLVKLCTYTGCGKSLIPRCVKTAGNVTYEAMSVPAARHNIGGVVFT